MKGHSMLQCMHALEAAGKSFGAKKLQELPELGQLQEHETTLTIPDILFLTVHSTIMPLVVPSLNLASLTYMPV